MKFKLFFIGYVLVIISLLFYSFSQVDLGLTLTKWSVWQVFQKFFQQIGYFNRPLSTLFYIVILALLQCFYILFLILAHKNLITRRQIWTIIIATSVILLFAYNAFSYDLFNYVFDAKIVTYYHQNPYEHKALDYLGEPMLGFMHWTQRTYPYGPVWLLLTVPLSFIGFGYFLFTLMLFKFMAFVSFLGSVFFMEKITSKVSPKIALFSLVFFALNPLVIIESLVSAHNDIVMIFLSLAALYLLVITKYSRSFILLVMSIGVKFATVFLTPIFLILFLLQKQKKKINYNIIFYFTASCMVAPVIFASMRTNFQPWYLLYVLPFAAPVSRKYFVLIPSMVISFFALLQYIPFLYLGNWDPPVPTILYLIMAGSILTSVVFTSAWFVCQRLVRQK